MGIEAVLALSDENAITEVEKAISCRNVGTLIVSPHVRKVSKTVLDAHSGSGLLPFVLTLNG